MEPRKYRGIPIDGKDFVYGWYFQRAGASFIIPISDKYHTPASFVLTFVQVIQETVGQSTGLKKNGKEIYVGMGGIHPEFGKYVVCLGLYSTDDGEQHYGFYIEWQDELYRKTLTQLLPFFLEDGKMLFDMNIHQNKELLNK